ncbi:hypothetical protein Scep_017865 [Stephania cephalantha]|uniref:J domain-containing protein n=1 Tax=Stephania cephalantha TaxID=152367 RepID=A0AAP0IQB7_9MAGN
MHISSTVVHPCSMVKPDRSPKCFHARTPMSRLWKKRQAVIRCCDRGGSSSPRTVNYYELLGVSSDSNPQQIKDAYRKLQKKYHPDVAGQKGHAYTLLLNEAYQVLMRDDLRQDYDASIGRVRGNFGESFTGVAYSSWRGPCRPQALFVDENACIGCRECVHHASNTFTLDEALGCARVKVQYGDDDKQIEVSVDSCPVNCIHWVDREELAALEYLVQPQPKEAYGVFGGGWERPSNVFAAAKFFNKRLKEQHQHAKYKDVRVTVEEETPEQVKARVTAAMKLQVESFLKIWSWLRKTSGVNQ